MKRIFTVRTASKGFIVLSALSILSVSIMALLNPQMVMDLVQVNLPNNDAYSSIRGVYGGVGITLCVAIVYTMQKNLQESLGLLGILWGSYALCRIITVFNEGQLGAFGNQWMKIELIFFFIALILFQLNKRSRFQLQQQLKPARKL
ncbi:MAG TPA: DUF4345 domain-containing protein [Chitinophagaceae bacterium]|nr:DUF4345 domain-containing protein [Chitinophagaceae bacterium]